MSPRASGPERPFADALETGGLVADGGMGTQLYERGVLFSVNFEELVLSRPELLERIHEDYVLAGAQIIETNTFGANALRLGRQGLEKAVREINGRAVEIARRAAGQKAYVAGAIGPTGLTLADIRANAGSLSAAFREQADALAGAGVDLLLVETMRHPEELELAVGAAKDAVGTSVPVIAQVSIDEQLAMADGTSVVAIAEKLKERGIAAFG